MQHSVIAPSSAFRWVECPASVPLGLMFPDEENEAAREGNAAHWVAAEILDSWKAGSEQIKHGRDFIGKLDPDGTPITEAVVDTVEPYIVDVLAVCQRLGALRMLEVESKVESPTLINPASSGTSDAWLWSPQKLIIWDLKAGRKLVEAFENWQAIDYAAGIIERIMEKDGVYPQGQEVEIRIVQPNAWHPAHGYEPRVWKTTTDELRGYFNRLHNAAGQALGHDPQAKAGAHCYQCKARHACESLHRSALVACEIAAGSTPMHLPPEGLGSEIEHLRKAQTLIKERLEGLEAEAMGRIEKGEPVVGFGIGNGRSSYKWSKPVEEVLALGQALGHDLRKPDPITPTQAGKLIDPEVIKQYATRYTGKATLIASDKTVAAAAFQKT